MDLAKLQRIGLRWSRGTVGNTTENVSAVDPNGGFDGIGNHTYAASIDRLGDGPAGSPQAGTDIGNATITTNGFGNYTVAGNNTFAAAGREIKRGRT